MNFRIGEKMLEWSDENPSMDEILTNVSIYWFTNSISTSFYPYREVRALRRLPSLAEPSTLILFIFKSGYRTWTRLQVPRKASRLHLVPSVPCLACFSFPSVADPLYYPSAKSILSRNRGSRKMETSSSIVKPNLEDISRR